ncbi:unnamed protein product [Dovyalis caffra]|uniref:Uncharacterized protein n=1 Tax=Dovyalis caffra TaxID=77055 RepID=A0AAV1SM58_9ROSI|nr:unnamed protein product [Dovyalis caffra]
MHVKRVMCGGQEGVAAIDDLDKNMGNRLIALSHKPDAVASDVAIVSLCKKRSLDEALSHKPDAVASGVAITEALKQLME